MSGISDEIRNLKKNDECLFFDGENTKKCTIVEISDDDDGLNFTVTIENNDKKLKIPASSVVLSNKNNDKLNGILEELEKELDILERSPGNSASEKLFKILNDWNNNTSNKSSRFLETFGNESFINFSMRILTLTNVSLKENKKAKVHSEWLKTCSLTLSILCHIAHEFSKFLNNCVLNDNLMNAVKELFEVLNKRQKRITAEEDMLMNVIRLYYTILKSGLEFKIPITSIMEECFRSKDDDLQIKTGTALCLSYLIDKSCPILGDVYVYLETVRRESSHDLCHFTDDEILIGLGKTSLKVDHDYILLSQLTKNFADIKIGGKIDFTLDTHKNLTLLYENISKINKHLIKLYTSKEFIEMIRLIVTEFQSLLKLNKKLDIKDKIFLDCVMTTLSIVCDLCYFEFGKIEFITNITFMYALKDVFKSLLETHASRSLEAQFLENVVFIFCNILKSRISLCLDDISIDIYNCFNLKNINNQTKMAAALCISSMECPNSDLKTNIKIYLENILTEDSSYHIYGFIRTEILSALAQVSLTKKDPMICRGYDNTIDSTLSFEVVLQILFDTSKFVREIPVSLLKRALPMNNSELLGNLIKNVSGEIDLNEHSDIFDRCYKDIDLFMELLKKFHVPQNKYQNLIDLLSSVSDISKVKVICKRFETERLTSEYIQQLLGQAFCYAKQNKFEEFKQIIEICTQFNDCDNFLKMTKEESAKETFLTKMLQELNVTQMDSIWKIKKFSMNCPNESGKSPIVIAAGSLANLQWFVKNNVTKVSETEWDKAFNIVNDIDDKNERKALLNILFKCKPS